MFVKGVIAVFERTEFVEKARKYVAAVPYIQCQKNKQQHKYRKDSRITTYAGLSRGAFDTFEPRIRVALSESCHYRYTISRGTRDCVGSRQMRSYRVDVEQQGGDAIGRR